jgi:1,4-dihydroxy-2-naphthoate octaprenyltransferase
MSSRAEETAGSRVQLLRPWVNVARPGNLFHEAVPLLVGASLVTASGNFPWLRFLALAAIGLTIQPAVRYLNDPSDYYRGIDQPGRLKAYHALNQGLDLALVRRVGLVCLAISMALCVWVSLQVDWRLLLVAGAIAFFAVTYAGGPWPYGSRALGELAQFVWWGLLPTVLVVYVLGGRVGFSAWIAGCALGAMFTTFQLANNQRDVETDRVGGKITLPQLIGGSATRRLFAVLMVVPYLLLVTLVIGQSNPLVLLPLLSIPFAGAAIRDFWKARTPADFALLFPMIARANLGFGLLLALGLWIHWR